MARHGKMKGRQKRPAMAAPKMASPHRFTMQQEALNTETHHRSWSHNNLRSKAVTFVRAGELQRSEFENVEQDGPSSVEKPAESQPNRTTEGEGIEQQQQQQQQPPPQIETEEKDTEEQEEPPLFVIDTVGESVPDTGLPDPTIPDSDQSDETSEDEVVFTGRNAKPIVIDESEVHIVQNIPESGPVHRTEELTLRTQQSHPTHNHRKPPQRKRHQWSPDNDDMIADYIANMDQDYLIEEEDDRAQVEIEGGAGVSDGMANSGSSSAEDNDEDGVEDSIDVLAKMYLDTKPDPTATSDKEDVELATPGTSDVEFDEDDDDEDDLDTDLLEQLALEYASTHKKKKGRAGKGAFPSASAFADAIDDDPYYGFDIMDFNRPSLMKPGRGKKPPALDMDWMLSDSELEHLQEVWQTDRKKKKEKKQEREELRSQGLLGKDPENADLRARYSKGMNMEELMTELRAFLMSSKSSLSLPPMTKNRRKTIHELANIVNLKSQSRGNGLNRFPILIKTSRTPGYTRKTISKVDSLLSGRKLNRRLFQSWGPDASRPKTKTRSGGGGVTAGVSYMDGEVVGASAPEIGAGNRGRAMLEKMGWSSGTALGASNNKGILQPVAHVVKNSRAGLG